MTKRLSPSQRKGDLMEHHPRANNSHPGEPETEPDIHRLVAVHVRHVLHEEAERLPFPRQDSVEVIESARSEIARQSMQHDGGVRRRETALRGPDMHLVASEGEFPGDELGVIA